MTVFRPVLLRFTGFVSVKPISLHCLFNLHVTFESITAESSAVWSLAEVVPKPKVIAIEVVLS